MLVGLLPPRPARPYDLEVPVSRSPLAPRRVVLPAVALAALAALSGCSSTTGAVPAGATEPVGTSALPVTTVPPASPEDVAAVDALVREVSALDVQALQGSARSLGDARDAVRAAIDEMRAATKEAVTYHAANKTECAGVGARAATVERLAATVAERVAAATQQADALKAASDGLQAQLDGQQARLADAQTKLAGTPEAGRLPGVAETLTAMATSRAALAEVAVFTATDATDAADASAKSVENAQKVLRYCENRVATQKD